MFFWPIPLAAPLFCWIIDGIYWTGYGIYIAIKFVLWLIFGGGIAKLLGAG
jgi:hypothetical protein